MNIFKIIGSIAAAALLASSASAATLTADFEASLALPSFDPDPRVFQSLNEDVAGAPDLTEADEISNPNCYSGHVDMDLSSSGLLTLTGQQPFGFANYELAMFTVSNIVFDTMQSIIGVSVISDDILDPIGFDVVAPTISFTADSFTIEYDAAGGQFGEFEFLDGGTSTFQILTSADPISPVPLPAAFPMLLAAMGGMGFVARRRKTAQA